MENKKIFNNDPTNFFFNQDKTITEEQKNKAIEFSQTLFNKKSCPICEEEYDLASKTPRIIISCGHTFCTSCLFLFFKDYRIKCPICLKTVKRLISVEILPINHIIYKDLISTLPPEKISDKNKELRLPKDLMEELEKEEIELPFCDEHNDRFLHFFIPSLKKLFCRVCLENKDCEFDEEEVQDLYCLQKDDIEKILYVVENNSNSN